jgi:hypothetical protein
VAVSFAPEKESRAKVLAYMNLGNTCCQIANQDGDTAERMGYHSQGLAHLNTALQVAHKLAQNGASPSEKQFGKTQVGRIRENIAMASKTSLDQAVDKSRLNDGLAQVEQLLRSPHQLQNSHTLTLLKADLLLRRAGIEIEEGGSPNQKPLSATLNQSMIDISQALGALLKEPLLDIHMLTAFIKNTAKALELATITTPSKRAGKPDKVELPKYAKTTVLVIVGQLATAGLFSDAGFNPDFTQELDQLKGHLRQCGLDKEVAKVQKKAQKRAGILA